MVGSSGKMRVGDGIGVSVGDSVGVGVTVMTGILIRIAVGVTVSVGNARPVSADALVAPSFSSVTGELIATLTISRNAINKIVSTMAAMT